MSWSLTATEKHVQYTNQIDNPLYLVSLSIYYMVIVLYIVII